MDAYDNAVEWALTHDMDPDEHLADILTVRTCPHAMTSINLFRNCLECADCGALLVDYNGWVSRELRVPR